MKRKKGQALVEYALIGATVILVLVGATKGMAYMMKSQVEGTSEGLSSQSYIKD
ncbi:MAG: hypothetical protein U0457_07665 [Candidatus Sericytochromatia bacterium]